MNVLAKLLSERTDKNPIAVYSACSAQPLVLEAVLEHAEKTGTPALIEATANQVNQFGGYTGMQPADFVEFVGKLKKNINCNVILGGDHLGPLVWQHLPESEAMALSGDLIEQYVRAGFSKIHLDASMRLAGDPEALSTETVAARAAALCARAELAADPENPPVYVIGSEVPIPGGAQEHEESISVTKPGDLVDTLSAFKNAFFSIGLQSAWTRVIAVVVQPGVEFGDDTVFEYNRDEAAALTAALKPYAPLVFEGHSTDYQTPKCLREMSEDGIAILKVGPALTFALREGLFALSDMEKWLVPAEKQSNFKEVLEAAMLKNPDAWRKHYHGSEAEQSFKRRFSFSDRARYYLTDAEVERSMATLLSNINDNPPPLSLISQYMPSQYVKLREGRIELTAEALVKSRVTDCIETYPAV